MQYLNIALGLVATASAIHIRFHINNRGCSGNALVCFNVNPGASKPLNTHHLPHIL
jgi:hypothetical protein